MTSILRTALDLAAFLRCRTFALSLLSLSLAITIVRATDLVSVADIQAGEAAHTAIAADSSDSYIFTRTDIVTLAYDAADTKSLKPMLADTTVSGFTAYVKADGKTKKIMVTGGTIGELISKANIELGELDESSHPLENEIMPGDIVEITRKEYRTITINETIPFETIYVYSSKQKPGTKKTEIEGINGRHVETIRQFIVNGEVIEETQKSSEITKEPVAERVIIGFPSMPVSELDFEYSFDSDYEPIGYTSVMRGQKSAAYSAPDGAYTASGRKAAVGYVAVNPNVIPYGTKLFIKSGDGKYFYGYAIAADTGTSLMNGVIAIDLFYGSYNESVVHGIKNVDIFILGDKPAADETPDAEDESDTEDENS